MRQYFVYILASDSRVLYVGVTNDLHRRVWQHKTGVFEGFSKRYHVFKLVYYEELDTVRAALRREQDLKRLPRWRKERLIDSDNADWRDLSADWYPGTPAG